MNLDDSFLKFKIGMERGVVGGGCFSKAETFLKFKVGMEQGVVGGGCFSKPEKMATVGVPLGSPSSTFSSSSQLTLDRG